MTVKTVNLSAVGCRVSCHVAGYFDDPLAGSFLDGLTPKHDPVTNYGTYLRTTIIDNVLVKFVKKHQGCQVVSLGAGFDTRYNRLLAKKECQKLEYIEVDYPPIIAEKASKKLPNAATYIGADLSRLQEIDGVFAKLDDKVATFVICECILSYLPFNSADYLIKAISNMRNAELIVFDVLGDKNDLFVKQMQRHVQNVLICFT